MSISGPAPKPADERIRRHKDTVPATYLEWDGVRRGPDLPRAFDWQPQTRKWWRHWRDSANAQVMTDLDWDQMLETAMLVDKFWTPSLKRGDVSLTQLASEIRRRVAAFGANFEDRLKLRMHIKTDASGKDESKMDDAIVDELAIEMAKIADDLNKRVAEQGK